MRKIIIGVIVIIALISAFILYSSNEKYFAVPDKIILYKDGDTKTINNEDKLFDDIVKQINKRANNNMSIAKLGFHKDGMDSLKQQEIAIEFIYSKIQVSKTGVGREYTHLIFPLTGDYSNLCFFETNGGDNYSGPEGPLESSDSVLDLVK